MEDQTVKNSDNLKQMTILIRAVCRALRAFLS
mgnify:CR=1 FL=1